MNLHIRLVRAPLAAGIVLTPSGESAAGATLVLCGHRESAQMNHSGSLLAVHAVAALPAPWPTRKTAFDCQTSTRPKPW